MVLSSSCGGSQRYPVGQFGSATGLMKLERELRHRAEAELRYQALQTLRIGDSARKLAEVAALAQPQPPLPIDTAAQWPVPADLPGLPAKLVLVAPTDLTRRSPFTPEGRRALLHAVAHIEFNAINLALDAIWRFPGMPEAYYRDWLQVATEESQHFSLL